ncbi:DUF4357 domain-containing protein [Candidatus Accumulibacter sp. ACC007]|uniref:DUF4357 domain-containing protein n=1 Tax=Candidatus Accumulibacter sp. ACC007 TaxID=2823333 RepID=UPI0025BFB3F2|nr:DUF4357 domain-containing protein [Candidatus Accumulibacter sp. ACC007]
MDDDGVQTAFELILEEIGSVSKELKESAKRLVDKDDFDSVSALMGTGKRLDTFQLKVKALQKEWVEAFDPGTRGRTHYEPVAFETATTQLLQLTMTYAEAWAEADCIGREVTILAGSFVRKQTFESLHANVLQRRKDAEKKGILVLCNNPELLEVKSAAAFTSPSAAAQFVAGCSVSGPREWQVKGKGVSLKHWKAKQE